MGNRLFVLSLLALIAASCQLIDRQVPSKDVLLEKELKAINWDEVDEWPSVAACDSIQDKTAARQCFYDFLSDNIRQRMNADTLAVLYPELDTVAVKVIVNADASVKFRPVIPDSSHYSGPAIDSIIQARLSDFPNVKPAVKRGLPVKTQFELPVVLNIEKKTKKKRRR